MKIVKQEIVDCTPLDYEDMVELVYHFARISYLAEDEVIFMSEKEDFIRMRISAKHESVLEHCVINVKIVCNRGVSHELVRHRIGSYTQESTRFCNYGKDRFNSQLTFIWPNFFPEVPTGEFKNYDAVFKAVEGLSPCANMWIFKCLADEQAYLKMLQLGAKPQEARDVLPNALKTVVGTTYNIRQWRDMLSKRALGVTGKPHPQMQEVADLILDELRRSYPVFFEDIYEKRWPDNE